MSRKLKRPENIVEKPTCKIFELREDVIERPMFSNEKVFLDGVLLTKETLDELIADNIDKN